MPSVAYLPNRAFYFQGHHAEPIILSLLMSMDKNDLHIHSLNATQKQQISHAACAFAFDCKELFGDAEE